MASVRYLSFGGAFIILALYLTNQVSATTCPGYYVKLHGGCFLFVASGRNWEAAEANCEANGGNLAVIKDGNLYGAILDIITSHVGMKEKHIWIGGSDQATEGDWLWITGERMNMGSLFWGRGLSQVNQPTVSTRENCLCLIALDRHRFHDCECSLAYASICQTAPLS